MINLLLLRFLFLLFLRFKVVIAHWVDPDTPLNSYKIQPYIPRVRNVPREKADEDDDVIIEHRRKHPTHSPTLSPSNEPTQSPTMTPTDRSRQFEIVFSDEFNTPGRSFEDGKDPRWTALNKNDYTNDALHYYNSNNVKTNKQGELVIRSEAVDTEVIGFDDVKLKHTHVTKHFRSGMIQSWNKFCFTGGIVEVEAELPGRHDVGGLWPALWMLGNLARHTYVGSSEHIWPWSSSTCTSKSQYSQHISGCANVGHYGMKSHLGRGAPEIDIFEVQPGPVGANTGSFLKSSVGQPFMSASYQVAPGKAANRPGSGWWPGPGQWYEGLKGGVNTSLNIYFYGTYNHFSGDDDPVHSDYWSDAISYNRQLNASYFEKPHIYRLEWEVPTDHTNGYIRWYLDSELILSIDGSGIDAAGLGSEISSEPMYLILNTAISKQWGFPKKCPLNCPCKNYNCNSKMWAETCGFAEGFCEMMKKDTPEYKINWVRVYQDPNNEKHKVGCSTPERPTRKYIKAHEKAYKKVDDAHPLKALQRGRGLCDSLAKNPNLKTGCGGAERGNCSPAGVCECHPGWTGPHCLVHEGYDPVNYDLPDKISDLGFVPPSMTSTGLLVGFCCLFGLLSIALFWKRWFDGWKPVFTLDDSEKKPLTDM
mmetsp:Transcript_31418/g.34785  ORF Transcript_31418/g.34785 Transcript_31418/m.34785 type:complete len:647 (+) Transcript_31418:99-2039(+)